jgi:hypothetical protein
MESPAGSRLGNCGFLIELRQTQCHYPQSPTPWLQEFLLPPSTASAGGSKLETGMKTKANPPGAAKGGRTPAVHSELGFGAVPDQHGR